MLAGSCAASYAERSQAEVIHSIFCASGIRSTLSQHIQLRHIAIDSSRESVSVHANAVGLTLAVVGFFGKYSDSSLSYPMVSFPGWKQGQIDAEFHGVEYPPYKSPSDPKQQQGQPKRLWTKASGHSLYEKTAFDSGSVITKQVHASSRKLTWGEPQSSAAGCAGGEISARLTDVIAAYNCLHSSCRLHS